MSDRRVGEAWDDARLDRALRNAVAVEPSPALRVRVRARIAAEPVPSTGPFALWTGMAAGTAAAAIVLVAILFRGGSAPVATPVVAARPASLAPLPYPSAIPQVAAARNVRSPAAPEARARRGSAPPVPAPPGQPLFAPADRAGFALLLAFSRSGRLLPLESLPPVSRDLDVVVPIIEFTSIDMPAVVVSTVGEGVSK